MTTTPNPKPITITEMLRYGSTWTATLSCGCAIREITNDDLRREQLYIGKAMTCELHGTAT